MTARVIPMARAKGIFAQFRAMEANYKQSLRVLIELAAALEDVAPNHSALEEYRLFIHGAQTQTDQKPESR